MNNSTMYFISIEFLFQPGCHSIAIAFGHRVVEVNRNLFRCAVEFRNSKERKNHFYLVSIRFYIGIDAQHEMETKVIHFGTVYL